MLAAFARHQPRDLSDIHDLASLLTVQQMLDDAQLKDHGFDSTVLAEMILRTTQTPDELWPVTTDVAAIRTFMAQLVGGLINRTELPSGPPREPLIGAYRRADGTIVRGYRRRGDYGDGQARFARVASWRKCYIVAPMIQGANSFWPYPKASLLVSSPDATRSMCSKIWRPF